MELEKSTSGFGEQKVEKGNTTGGKQKNATSWKGNATSGKEKNVTGMFWQILGLVWDNGD